MDLTSLLFKKFEPKQRDKNRFNISDLWGIVNGYVSPQEYLKGEQVSFQEAVRMWKGTSWHEAIGKLFEGIEGYEIEKKIEYPYQNKFILVGKADLLSSTEVIEIKTSDRLLEQAKKWHLYQLQWYLNLFDRKEGIIVQPVIKKDKLELKEIGRIKKDKNFLKEELPKIENFWKKLNEL